MKKVSETNPGIDMRFLNGERMFVGDREKYPDTAEPDDKEFAARVKLKNAKRKSYVKTGKRRGEA